MSWLAYETLMVIPDQRDSPRSGLADERIQVPGQDGSGFVAWPGRTDRIFHRSYQTFSPSEWRSLRDFFDRQAGRAKAFFHPSWQQDFRLASNSPTGSDTIALEGNHHSDNPPDRRPDSIGRVILLQNLAGQTSIHWVETIVAAGANDNLTISPPLQNPLEAGKTLVSICYLSRLADDTVESEILAPGVASISMTLREITHRRNVNQQESAAGTAVQTMEPAFDILATDEDPIYDQTRETEALGPITRGAPQTDPYQSTWKARVQGNTIVLTDPKGGEFTSPLYNGTTPPNHIAMMFDASAREILAWQDSGDTFTIAFYGGDGQPERLTFEGRTPCCFNTFGIDATVDSGTATIAVFYLRPGDATIYCRTASQTFATENRYTISPVAPLALYRAVRVEARMEIVGMDAGHRRTRWRSETYQTPIPLQILNANPLPVTGSYRAVQISLTTDPETFSASPQPITGEYRSVRLEGSTGDGAPVASPQPITGEYRSIRLEASSQTPGPSALAKPLAGEYKLVRRTKETSSQGPSASPQPITGSYAPTP